MVEERHSTVNARHSIATDGDFHVHPATLRVPDKKFYESVKENFGNSQIARSIIQSSEDEWLFRKLLEDKAIKHAVEIGTCRGTSTALLAHYADKVTTFDIHNYLNKYLFWIEYQVMDKISPVVIKTEAGKAATIAALDFDFAFVDGNHTFEGVSNDFEMVKKCGRVLFHDYYFAGSYKASKCKWGEVVNGVEKLVDSLPQDEVTIMEPFAYWEAK